MWNRSPGGAALFFKKDPSPVEVLNDVSGDIVCLYRVVQHHLEEFIRQFRWSLVSRQMFEWLNHTPPETLTDIQRAARFYYLQKLAFGAKATGRTFGTAATTPPRLNLTRIEEELSAAHLRLARVTVEHLDWAKCMERYDRPDTLFYVDPPYWQTEGYGADFGWDSYERLALAMGSIKGKAIVSINDHPDIRQAFCGLPMRQVDIAYTVGGKRAARQELVILNWNGL